MKIITEMKIAKKGKLVTLDEKVPDSIKSKLCKIDEKVYFFELLFELPSDLLIKTDDILVGKDVKFEI